MSENNWHRLFLVINRCKLLTRNWYPFDKRDFPEVFQVGQEALMAGNQL